MKTLSPPGYVKNSFASWSPLLLSSSNTEVGNIPPQSLFGGQHCNPQSFKMFQSDTALVVRNQDYFAVTTATLWPNIRPSRGEERQKRNTDANED